jgi:hypothetical protein
VKTQTLKPVSRLDRLKGWVIRRFRALWVN